MRRKTKTSGALRSSPIAWSRLFFVRWENNPRLLPEWAQLKKASIEMRLKAMYNTPPKER